MDIKNIKFDQQDIDNFVNKLTNKTGNKGWKIKVNGEFIKVASGKSLWTTKGFAKSALKGHFEYIGNLPDHIAKKYLKQDSCWYKDRNKLWNHFLDFLQAKGILEFIELK